MRNLIYLTLILLFASCSSEEELSNLLPITSTETILRERPSDNPWNPFTYNEFHGSTRSIPMQHLSLKDYLGYSFKNDIMPIQDTRNLGYRVIDISNFSKDYPNYFQCWENLSHEAKVYSFNSFDDYISKSETSKKVEHGFDFKLLNISIGHKHEYSSIFGQQLIDNNKSVFGELNIFLRDSCYRMQYSSDIQKEIQKKYLDKVFIKDLHSMHPYDVFKRYGSLVASNYSSGGCATAFYTGIYNKVSSENDKEINLSSEINNSYTWKEDAMGGNLKIGRGNTSNISVTNSFSSVLVSVKTLGGSAFGGYSIPQELGTSSIDLSSWISSLSNKSTDVIADFNPNGLIPISDFILEKNLKHDVIEFMNGYEPQSTAICEPYIVIIQVNPNYNDYSLNDAVLITRYGERIPLSRIWGTYREPDRDFSSFWQWIDNIANIFQLKVVNASALPSRRSPSEPILWDIYYTNLISHSRNYRTISKDGILYFVDEVDKMGFSILDNPQMIKEYGLTNFLSTLSRSSLKYEDLINDNYIINAL